MSHSRTAGIDVGGAHLKVALVDADGRCLLARQLPCRLWEGLDRLDAALADVSRDLAGSTRLAVTMTGELADLFADRAQGVAAILDRLAAWAGPGLPLRVFAGPGGFIAPEEACAASRRVASLNWLASAAFVAARVSDALLVDVGSTTTDLVVICERTLRTQAVDDASRLRSGELVYTGLTRTPLAALASRAPFDGVWCPLMAEHFATSADIWRLLGELEEGSDQHAAADGGSKTREGSARRLARMVGADAADATPGVWEQLASWLAQAQLRRIEDAMALLLSREPLGPCAPLVTAGVGVPITRRLAARAGRPLVHAAALVPAGTELQPAVAACFPAVAAASLLAEAKR